MGFKNEHVHGKKDVARINERNARGRRLRSALFLLWAHCRRDFPMVAAARLGAAERYSLARAYGVSHTAIKLVRQRETWAHVE
jgi:hypothetical protein